MKKIAFIFSVCLSFIFSCSVTYAQEKMKINQVLHYQNIFLCPINQKEMIEFPSTVTLIGDDSTTYIEDIYWDDSTVQWDQEGTYVVYGTLYNELYYENLPTFQITVSVQKQLLYLVEKQVNENKIIFNFQNQFIEENLLLDTSSMQVWACQDSQFQNDNNWYNITQHPNITLTSDSLTINFKEHIDSHEIYRLQISYQNSSFEHYSQIVSIFYLDDQLYVSQLYSGDRNGGNRIQDYQIVIPNDQPDQLPEQEPSQDDEIDIIPPAQTQSDISHNEEYSTQESDSTSISDDESSLQTNVIQDTQNSSTPQTQDSNLNTTTSSTSLSQKTAHSSQNNNHSSTFSKTLPATNFSSQQTTDNEDTSSEKQTNYVKTTYSAQEVKIYPKPFLGIFFFTAVGIILGILSIRKSDYEKK